MNRYGLILNDVGLRPSLTALFFFGIESVQCPALTPSGQPERRQTG